MLTIKAHLGPKRANWLTVATVSISTNSLPVAPLNSRMHLDGATSQITYF